MTTSPLTVSQAARASGFSVRTVRKAIQVGTLKASKPGHDWLIEADELTRWREDKAAHTRGRRRLAT